MSVRVEVYKNIHATKAAGQPVYSVRLKSTGVVVQHCTQVGLGDPQFIVSEAGRRRVIAEGRKNVHAWIEGELIWCVPIKDTPFETTESGDAIVDGRVIRPYKLYSDCNGSEGGFWRRVGYNPYDGAPHFSTQVWGSPGSIKRPLTRDGRFIMRVETEADALAYREMYLPWVSMSEEGIYSEAFPSQNPPAWSE